MSRENLATNLSNEFAKKRDKYIEELSNTILDCTLDKKLYLCETITNIEQVIDYLLLENPFMNKTEYDTWEIGDNIIEFIENDIDEFISSILVFMEEHRFTVPHNAFNPNMININYMNAFYRI